MKSTQSDITKSSQTAAPSRRQILTGSVATIAAGAIATAATAARAAPIAPRMATGAAEADRDLLLLCQEFHRRHHAAASAEVGDDAGLTAALASRWAVSDRIAALPARTLDGRRAKAEIAALLLHENGRDEEESADLQFAMAVLEELKA